MRLKTKIAGAIMALSMIGLTGCNKDIFDTHYTFNKAIISLNGQTKVYDIVSWTDYDGEQFQLELTDGSIIVSSSYNTILVYTSGGESQIVKDFCHNNDNKK